jgi:hypothetical protein
MNEPMSRNVSISRPTKKTASQRPDETETCFMDALIGEFCDASRCCMRVIFGEMVVL